jgi:hypothetical protein
MASSHEGSSSTVKPPSSLAPYHRPLGKEITYLAMVFLLGIDGGREACVWPNLTFTRGRRLAKATVARRVQRRSGMGVELRHEWNIRRTNIHAHL